MKRTDGNTRAEQLATVSVVMRAIPDVKARREVLDALFAQGRQVIPPHGSGHSKQWQEARKAWLARCRRWVVKQGRHPYSTQISADDQRAYVAATGDVFDATEVA